MHNVFRFMYQNHTPAPGRRTGLSLQCLTTRQPHERHLPPDNQRMHSWRKDTDYFLNPHDRQGTRIKNPAVFFSDADASLRTNLQSDTLPFFPSQNRLFPSHCLSAPKKRNENPQSAVLQDGSEMLTFQTAFPLPLSGWKMPEKRPPFPPHVSSASAAHTFSTRRTRHLEQPHA